MAAVAALTWTSGAGSAAVVALVAGQMLFSANLLLLVWVGGRLFGAAAGGGGGKPGKLRTALLLVAMFVKVMLLATGAYVGLVLFDLKPAYFVSGLFAGLVCLALPMLGRAALIRRSGKRRLERAPQRG